MTTHDYTWDNHPQRTGRYHCTPERATCHNCGKQRLCLPHAYYPWGECRECTNDETPNNAGRCVDCNEIADARDPDGWCRDCGGTL